jgi:ferredoxin
MMFADDVSGRCVSLCPSSITFTGQSAFDYFHDLTNRRCVTNCPSNAPYRHWFNKTCLSDCPTNFYKLDSNMSCVQACPSSTTIRLYIDTFLNKCVDDC